MFRCSLRQTEIKIEYKAGLTMSSKTGRLSLSWREDDFVSLAEQFVRLLCTL